MKLKQITISLENRHGRLYEVTRDLGNAGINIRALNLVDTGAFGQLRLLASDVPRIRRILMKKQMPACVDEVVAVEIEDRPGSLADLLVHLYNTDINVIYSYAFVGLSAGNAVMIFRFNDNDKAIHILQEKGVKILDAKAFGIVDPDS
jgi:hypothetical protein